MKRIILIIAFALTGLAVWAQKPSKEPEINLDSLYQGWDDQLEELVVIGYGERKREYLTGSVAQVSSKEILKAPVTNAQQLLTGPESHARLNCTVA